MAMGTVLGFYSTWPMLAITAGGMALVSTSPFRLLDAAPEQATQRDVTLDGLRSFLALAVFFSHMVVLRQAIATGNGQLPSAHVYAYLGSFGVSLFFMITGYLFWGRLLYTHGRPGWIKLYVRRFFRIVPLYWALIAIYFAVTLYRTGFHLPGSVGETTTQAVKWLAIGAYPFPQPFLGDLASMPLVGMTWTLFYEWVFYASLLGLALIARLRRSLPIVVLGLLATLIAQHFVEGPVIFYVALFLCGMLTASITQAFPRVRGDGPVRALAAIALLLGAFACGNTTYSISGVCFLGAFFLLIASGTSLFGVLLTRGAVRLGHASYSIYLLHGVVLWVLFSRRAFGIYATGSPLRFWSVAALTTVALMMVASLTYLVIEKKGIALGHWALRQMHHRPPHA